MTLTEDYDEQASRPLCVLPFTVFMLLIRIYLSAACCQCACEVRVQSVVCVIAVKCFAADDRFMFVRVFVTLCEHKSMVVQRRLGTGKLRPKCRVQSMRSSLRSLQMFLLSSINMYRPRRS